MEGSETTRQWEGDCRELVRFGLLMRRIALDWTLSRRWREDLGTPPPKHESSIWSIFFTCEGKKVT